MPYLLRCVFSCFDGSQRLIVVQPTSPPSRASTSTEFEASLDKDLLSSAPSREASVPGFDFGQSNGLLDASKTASSDDAAGAFDASLGAGLLDDTAPVVPEVEPSNDFSFILEANGLLDDPRHSEGNTSSVCHPLIKPRRGTNLQQQRPQSPSTIPEFLQPSLFSASTAPTASSSASTSRHSIRATTFDGKPIHIKRKVKKRSIRASASSSSTSSKYKLLDVPIHRLLDNLAFEKAAELRAECVDSHIIHALAKPCSLQQRRVFLLPYSTKRR
jgi:hypothetical protein